MDEHRQGFVLQLINTRTGQVSYGCLGSQQWLIDKPLPKVEEVNTFEEAIRRPIYDRSWAITWCEAYVNTHRDRQYKVVNLPAG